MSSLYVMAPFVRNRCRFRNAFLGAKSSQWITVFEPYLPWIACTVSSSNLSYASPRTRSRRVPTYRGSASSFALFVPLSTCTGSSHPGLIPQAAYTMLFPALMPMPLTPWSPRPRMRSPSVRTAILTSFAGQLSTRARTLPRFSRET